MLYKKLQALINVPLKSASFILKFWYSKYLTIYKEKYISEMKYDIYTAISFAYFYLQ